jgi:hypothetical protein
VIVVMFGLWDAQPHRVHGHWLYPGDRGHDEHLAARARCAVDVLSSTGARVLFVLAPPTIQVRDERTSALNRVYTRVAEADPARVGIIDLRDEVMHGGQGYRWDGVHYTPEGAHAFAEMARTAIDAARDAPPSPTPPFPIAPGACAPGTVG